MILRIMRRERNVMMGVRRWVCLLFIFFRIFFWFLVRDRFRINKFWVIGVGFLVVFFFMVSR